MRAHPVAWDKIDPKHLAAPGRLTMPDGREVGVRRWTPILRYGAVVRIVVVGTLMVPPEGQATDGEGGAALGSDKAQEEAEVQAAPT